MNFKTPKTENLTNALAMGGSAVVGIGLGRGVNTLLPATMSKNTTTAIKGALALVSFVAVASINGNDTATQSLKAGLVGMGAEKTLSVVKDLLPATAVPNNAFVKSAIGLNGADGCGCSSVQLPQLNYTSPFDNSFGNETMNFVEDSDGSYTAEKFV